MHTAVREAPAAYRVSGDDVHHRQLATSVSTGLVSEE
jgi:hypothetical protein